MTDGVATQSVERTAERSTEARERADEGYERLREAKRERPGAEGTGTVESVYVGEREVSLTIAFDWRREAVTRRYALEDERDVARLEALADAYDLAFEQLGHLEGFPIDCAYADGEWVPTAHRSFEDGEGSLADTFRTELGLLGRELATTPRALRGGVQWLRGLSTRQAVLGVILVKKLIIAGALVWVLVL